MKTYKILSYVLIAFLLLVNLYDKLTLKAKADNIDKTDRFGAYYLDQELPEFEHVVLNGNRWGRVQFYQRKETPKIKFGEYMSDKFKANVKNDTLFINFDPSISNKSPMEVFTGGNNSLRNIIVFYDNITSLDQHNNRTYLNSRTLESLKVTGKKGSWFHINSSKIENLDIDLNSSWVTFEHGKPSYVDSLSLKIQNKSAANLGNLTASKHNLYASDDSRIKKNGFNSIQQ